MPGYPMPPAKKLGRGSKIVLSAIASIIGIIALIFGGFFVYYTWQFKYGDPQELKQIEKQLTNAKFTLADTRSKQKTVADKPVSNYIRPHNPVIGNPNAKVTFVEFIDFECPFSQASFAHIEAVKQNYGSAVKFVFKHMPLTSIHPNAVPAALAAQCAHEQNKFWPYYKLLFQTKKLDQESLMEAAKSLKLNVEQFSNCLETQKYSREVQEDAIDGLELGVRGTPTFFVNQQIAEGVLDIAAWNTVLLGHIK